MENKNISQLDELNKTDDKNAKLAQMLDNIFGKSKTPKIVTNMFGFILWHNIKNADIKEIGIVKFYAPNEVERKSLEITLRKRHFSGDASIFTFEDEDYCLITLIDGERVLGHFSNTNEYYSVMEIISAYTTNLKLIKKEVEDLKSHCSSMQEIISLEHQNILANELLAYTTEIEDMITAAFERELEHYSLSVMDTAREMMKGCKDILAEQGIDVQLDMNQCSDVRINTNPHYLFLLFSTIVRLAALTTADDKIKIYVSSNPYYAVYEVVSRQSDLIPKNKALNEFQYKISGFIVRSIGGYTEKARISDKIIWKIKIPLYKGNIVLFSPDKIIHKEKFDTYSSMLLSDIKEKREDKATPVEY